MMFKVYCLEIEAEATTPVVLTPHCGSALRGAIFNALWSRFCMNREAPSCYDCPLIEGCAVGSLVAPLRDDESISRAHWRDVARPYTIHPPRSEKEGQDQHYEPGETFTFGLTLFGTSTKLFPYVLRAFQAMEPYGIGRRLPALGQQRGRFRIREVRAYHPFTLERQQLWKRDVLQPQKPQVCVTQDDIATRANTLPTDRVILEFLSPTRLTLQKRLLIHPDFHTLTLRLAERFEQVLSTYGEQNEGVIGQDALGIGQTWYLRMGDLARTIQLIRDETRWIVLTSHSGRQQQTMSIGGFVGRAAFQGDITFLRELLVWGEVISVGKSVVKGDGAYCIVNEGSEHETWVTAI